MIRVINILPRIVYLKHKWPSRTTKLDSPALKNVCFSDAKTTVNKCKIVNFYLNILLTYNINTFISAHKLLYVKLYTI